MAGANNYQGAHIHLLGGEFAEGQAAQGFAGAADIVAEYYDGLRAALLTEDVQGAAELPGAGLIERGQMYFQPAPP